MSDGVVDLDLTFEYSIEGSFCPVELCDVIYCFPQLVPLLLTLQELRRLRQEEEADYDYRIRDNTEDL